MDVRKAVSQFVVKGTELFHLIKAEGDALTPVDLHMLKTQCQVLDVEAARLEGEKKETGQTSRRPDRPHRKEL